MSTLPADQLLGVLVDGRYRVLERLAEGGMATVYLATDTRLDREVALKVMREHLAGDETFVSRFRREARSAARLSHPAIVSVFDQGEDAGHVFLAMEYVPGDTVREVLDTEGALTPRAALDILERVLEGLAVAHQAGLIHRDIKPENVILREDGMVKVADFGLARAVTSQTVTGSVGTLLGTVAYLSPEQVERGIADARSDVYAAGLVLFEMLTGTKAFAGDTAINVAYQHVHRGVPAPSSRADGIPEALDDLVAAATARDPDGRPADAGALLEMLRRTRATLGPDELDSRPTPASARRAAAAAPTTALPATAITTASTTAITTASTTAPTQGPRRPRWPWVLVGLSALLAVATAWFFILGPGAVVQVPPVVGLTEAQAQATLADSDLRADVVGAFSEDVEKGVVLGTDPAPGARARQGSAVALTVSKGPERYAVPALVGTSLAAATSALEETNLASGAVTEAFSETVPEGQVISADPKEGTLLRPGSSVALSVSKGREPVTVEDYTGEPAATATKELEAAGLAVDASVTRNDDTVPKGSVISQDPAGGTLFKGEKVTLVVSEGPVLVAVPGVVGKQVDEAQQILEEAGFTVKVEKIFGGIFGTIRFQDPREGEKVPEGSTITIQSV